MAASPFDFSRAMQALCADIVRRLPEFHHVHMEQVAVTFAQTRAGVPHGLQAKLTPMRFAGGELVTSRSGRPWTVQRLFLGEREILYLLTFYLPRFLEHSFQEKRITVMHELYHISPLFNGDIRRHEGRYHVHSHSQKAYDQQMAGLVADYMRAQPPPALYQFLEFDFRTLSTSHGGVVGLRVPIPKLVPLSKSA